MLSSRRGRGRDGEASSALDGVRRDVDNAAKTLLANIRFMSVDRPIRTMVVTSAIPNEGKTFVATQLARAMATSGKRTLLVECDMRRRSLANELQVHALHGMHAVMSRMVTLEEAAVATSVAGLYLLDSEPHIPNPSDLLSSQRFDLLLEDAARGYDYVLFDTPPVATFVDAAVVGAKVDALIMVVRERYTRKEEVMRAAEQLKTANVPLAGIVMNFCDSQSSSYYYDYYSYHAPDDQAARAQRADREAAAPVTRRIRPTSAVKALDESLAPTGAHDGEPSPGAPKQTMTVDGLPLREVAVDPLAPKSDSSPSRPAEAVTQPDGEEAAPADLATPTHDDAPVQVGGAGDRSSDGGDAARRDLHAAVSLEPTAFDGEVGTMPAGDKEQDAASAENEGLPVPDGRGARVRQVLPNAVDDAAATSGDEGRDGRARKDKDDINTARPSVRESLRPAKQVSSGSRARGRHARARGDAPNRRSGAAGGGAHFSRGWGDERDSSDVSGGRRVVR